MIEYESGMIAVCCIILFIIIDIFRHTDFSHVRHKIDFVNFLFFISCQIVFAKDFLIFFLFIILVTIMFQSLKDGRKRSRVCLFVCLFCLSLGSSPLFSDTHTFLFYEARINSFFSRISSPFFSLHCFYFLFCFWNIKKKSQKLFIGKTLGISRN